MFEGSRLILFKEEVTNPSKTISNKRAVVKELEVKSQEGPEEDHNDNSGAGKVESSVDEVRVFTQVEGIKVLEGVVNLVFLVSHFGRWL